MNAKTKWALALAAVLVPAFFLAERYRSASSLPADFRDAPGSERAADELTTIAPGGGDSPVELPPVTPEAAVRTPGASGAAEEGAQRVYSENNPFHKRLAEALGMNYPCYVETKHLGDPDQLAEKLTLDDGRRKEAVVVKQAGTAFANKMFAGAVGLTGLHYERDDRKLFNNAVTMPEKFMSAGLNTLEIVLTDPEKRIMVSKFLKGEDMAAILQAALRGAAGAMQSVEKLGAALGTAHRNNLAVGDFNTGNIMLVEGKPYFIDLDQATVGGTKAWDLVLPFYHAICMKRLEGEPAAWKLVARTFLRGYLAGGGGVSAIREATSRKYTAFFAPIVAARGQNAEQAVFAVRLEIKKAAGGAPAKEPDKEPGPAQ